ncbi:CoA-binding protein [Pararhodobacter zhoushanensis]|uniref:CoA-binding protein n=1 Tax=Pararhodobacter zhoushanensis TaxID=2479545 RepID=A0ABT3GTE7_9RHOB|nr:CoA-binding protein [Pararhodobacter zhoushanensis]MCW1930784.1 CoA-binding protein [Pararhodobacter zhoushanensis]
MTDTLPPKGGAAPSFPDAPDDAVLRKILQRIKTVAVVGVSPNPVRPSYFVARYLKLKGKAVVPVNPGHAGEQLFGATVVADVTDLPQTVDTLDVFRRSEHVAPIVRAALDHLPGLKTVWLQIGVTSDEARAMCAERGVDFIQNRCPKIEYQRLFGELRMGGFNTGVISSKL